MSRYYVFGLICGLSVVGGTFYTYNVFGETRVTTIQPNVPAYINNGKSGQPSRVFDPIEGTDYSNYPYTYPITVGLRVGSSGNSVRSLQVFLNNDADTIISTKGLGSSGFESTYFGSKTALSLAKFQKKYNLVPTSIVDVQTLQKINEILYPPTNQLATTTSTTNQSVLPTAESLNSQLASYGLSLQDIESVTKKPSNTEELISNPFGNVSISNNGLLAPRITSITPGVVYSGDTISIYGANFTPNGNAVITSFDIFTNVSAQNGVITIPFKSELQNRANIEIQRAGNSKDQARAREALANNFRNSGIPLIFSVKNAGGISNSVQINMKLR